MTQAPPGPATSAPVPWSGPSLVALTQGPSGASHGGSRGVALRFPPAARVEQEVLPGDVDEGGVLDQRVLPGRVDVQKRCRFALEAQPVGPQALREQDAGPARRRSRPPSTAGRGCRRRPRTDAGRSSHRGRTGTRAVGAGGHERAGGAGGRGGPDALAPGWRGTGRRSRGRTPRGAPRRPAPRCGPIRPTRAARGGRRRAPYQVARSSAVATRARSGSPTWVE